MRKYSKFFSIILAAALMTTSVDLSPVMAAQSPKEAVGIEDTTQEEQRVGTELDEESVEESDDNLAEGIEDETEAAVEAAVGDIAEVSELTDAETETEPEDETAEAEENADLPAATVPWSVYIYMIGGNTESDYALCSGNIREMLKAESSENVNILLQAGGAKTWNLNSEEDGIEIDPDRTQRYLIKGSDTECVYDEEITDMSGKSALSDFLSWGYKNYPSEKSMVVLYGEGKGVLGFGTDEHYGDYLSVNDMADAFEKAGIRTDLLVFDASYMADLDVMTALSPYAGYMIASENAMSDMGLDYTNLCDSLEGNPDCGAVYIARKICDSYFENTRDAGEDYITLSFVDLSLINAVKEATAGYIDSLKNLYVSDQETFANTIASIFYATDYSTFSERDLRYLAEKTYEAADALELDAAGDFDDASVNVSDAVREAVQYKVQGGNSRENNGISLFYGFSQNSDTLSKYERACSNLGYLALMDALFYDYHPNTAIYNETEKLPEAERDYLKTALELTENETGFESAKFKRGESSLVNLDYAIYETDDQGRTYTIQERSDVEYYEKTGTYLTEFDGNVASLGGHAIVLQLDNEDDDGAGYTVPVSIKNSDGTYTDGKLYVYYDNTAASDDSDEASDDSSRYTIMGLLRSCLRNPDTVTYDIEDIKDGTIMRAAYPKSGTTEYKYGAEFTLNADTAIEMQPLNDGKYALKYFVKDGLNKKAESEEQTFYMKAGEVSLTDPDPENTDEGDDAEAGNAGTDSDAEETFVLPIISYKEYYGTDVPERLKDIHYDAANVNDAEASAEDDEEAEAEETVSEEAAAEDTSAKSKVTMLMYVCGSNLEAAPKGTGSDVINYATDIADSEDVNIVIETGGASMWKYDGLDTDGIQRFEAHKDNLVEISDTPAYNMSTGTAFSEFLNWGISNYPAEHYVLYAFDHGGAWLGTCWDDNFDSSHLSLDDWTYALGSTGVTFDNIIFDECLMASVEVASAVAPYAKYMTGYEVAQMCSDYQWNRVYNYIIKHSDNFNPVQFGKMVVDMNADTWEESLNSQIFQTMALIDLSKIETLDDALGEYAAELYDMTDDAGKFTKFVSNALKARSYDYAFQKDICELMDYSEGVSDKTRTNVKNAVENAVIYKRTQFDQLRNNGLTMCFDITNSVGKDDIYAKICPIDNYVEFLDKATTTWHAPEGTYEDDAAVESVNVLNYRVGYDIIADGSDKSGIRITENEDAVYKKSYQVLRYDEQQDRYYGVALRNDFTKGEDGEYYENFDGRVASVNGIPCYMKFSSFDGNRILYKIPIKVDGTNGVINVAFYPNEESDQGSLDANPQNGTYEILGMTYSALDIVGLPEKNVKAFEYGKEFTLVFPEFSKDGKELYQIDGDTLTYTEDMKVGYTCLEDGNYILRYTIENGLEQKDVSDDVTVVMENGRITSVSVPEEEE